jgi:hypothetical protein
MTGQVAACSHLNQPEVASLGSPTASPSPRATEEDLQACLQEQGIAMAVAADDSAGKSLYPQTTDSYIYCTIQSCVTVISRQATTAAQRQEETDRLSQAQATHLANSPSGTAPMLVIGGVDHTDALEACLAKTGYEAEPVEYDPQNELAGRQRIAARANEWAACAREQGYSRVQDAKVGQADGFETSPMALIPADMTTAQLEQLLADCPLRTPIEDGADVDNPGEFAPAAVGIDAPGFRGDPGEDPGDRDDLEHLGELEELIYRAGWED